MPKRDACGSGPPTNRSLDTAGSCSIALALTQSSPEPVSSPLPLCKSWGVVKETPGKALVPHRAFLSEIKDLECMRPETEVVGAAAYAPPLACPTSHEKGLSIAAAQVLLCVAFRLMTLLA